MAASTVPFALVVDDDPLILMDTTVILEDAGFRVHEAMDGEEAKGVLAEHWESISLLFSDVDMPGDTNGFDLARHANQHWPHIEIVIASGHVLPGEGDMPDRATFISKPFNKRTVHEHLAKMLPDDKKTEPLARAV
jgi:CheY-like chemotaxis protein